MKLINKYIIHDTPFSRQLLHKYNMVNKNISNQHKMLNYNIITNNI